MTWQPIDFQRIIALDKTLVDQLHRYLRDKEVHLATVILSAVPLCPGHVVPVLAPSEVGAIKLSDAVEGFGRKIRQLIQHKEYMTTESWKGIASTVNQAFWDYDEVLEGCVKELFQQLEQLGLEQWTSDVFNVLNAIKDLLIHQIEDLIWAAKRMESSLVEYRAACNKCEGKWALLTLWEGCFSPVMDSALLSNLTKSDKYLRIHHKRFSKRFGEYISLDEKVRQIMTKLKGYHILESLGEESQHKYENVYYFVKLWRLNQRSRILPVQELSRALNHAISFEATIDLFQKYSNAIKGAIFHQSRVLKKGSIRYLKDDVSKKMIEDVLKGYRSETLSLGSTIAKYKEFLLRTDPNPYVRTKWGFSDWAVGPEPEQTKKLMDLEYGVDNIETLLDSIERSIEGGLKRNTRDYSRIDPEIQRVLHEMGQPLTSYNMTRVRAELVLDYLKNLDELGSYHHEVVSYAGQLLSKLLRADWKFNVLEELPLYHNLFAIHVGVMGHVDDRKHMKRMNKFHHLIEEIEEWVKNREIRKHEHELELDINDLKGYLQDFLAQVQRIAKDDSLDAASAKSAIESVAYQLLIYRYGFGEFFHFLNQQGPDGKRIRNKLLFIDQYFESVEQKVHELRSLTWPISEEASS